jgi:hypothetical protein
VDERSGAGLVEQAERYRKLWAAVLLDALRLAARSRLRRWEQGANLVARAWLADDSRAVGSLWWVCQLLDRNVEDVRAMQASGQKIQQRRSALRLVA